jgi:chemotaxis protein MotA
MDIASFIGFISGLLLIVGAIYVGGDVDTFVNVPGMMIVFGGTLAATLLTFRFRDVCSAVKAAWRVFAQEKDDPNDALATMVQLCYISRKHGLRELGKVESDHRFIRKACSLISDGSEQGVIRNALRTEIESMKLRQFVVQDVFRKMGIYSPAFGMLGTLIGLVQMLSRLNEPLTIGPAMAIAILTTFYGSLLSTMVFLPIAGKLKAKTIVQGINLEIMFEGAVSILENNNPIVVYEKLSPFIPERSRRPLKEIELPKQHGTG